MVHSRKSVIFRAKSQIGQASSWIIRRIPIARGFGSQAWLTAMAFLGLAMVFPSCKAQVLADAPQPAGVQARVVAEPEQPQSLPNTNAPAVVTLQDAIQRARRYYAQYGAALTAARLAKENSTQARAALLPSISYTQQYLGTQGNGKIPTGRFVTNDGVHVYRAWAVLHQDMPAGFFTFAPYRSAAAAAAMAQAQAEIARRGLTVTVTKLYYNAIVSQRQYASAQQNLDQATNFLSTTEELETGGEVPRADVIRARLQYDQEKLALQEAQLAMDHAHLALAVLISPVLDENFTTVDDLDTPPVLPSLGEIDGMAEHANPYIRSAMAALKQAKIDVSIARAGFFPTFTLDVDYGIEANAFALRSTAVSYPQYGPVPNLGYFVTAGMNLPIWNWGSTVCSFWNI